MDIVAQRMRSESKITATPDVWGAGFPGLPVRLSWQASALAVVVLGLWMLWNLTATPVVVVVDGVADTVYTHRRAVGALLADVGLPLDMVDADRMQFAHLASTQWEVPSQNSFAYQYARNDAPAIDGWMDRVRLSHNLDARIEDGLQLTIERSQRFLISADGRDLSLSSWAATPADLLDDAEIGFYRQDQVMVNGSPGGWFESLPAGPTRLGERGLDSGYAWTQIEREPVQVQIKRSTLLSVDDGNMPYTIRTTAETVGEALREAGITIYLGDHVQPSLGTPVSTGLQALIRRSTPISLLADGRLTRTRTQSRTVGDALAEMEVGLTGLDEVYPALDARLYENMQITIVRVWEEIDLEEDIAPFETVFVGDPDLLIDTRQLRPGAAGITRRRYRVRYEDDQEVARSLEDVWIAQEPRQEVVAYGQKIVPRTFVDAAGQEVIYWRKIRMRATSYSASTAGVSPDLPWYGRTRTGDAMRQGVVAVDPSLIPLRSRVYVPGYGHGDALDTGNAILSRRIDLGYDDDKLVLWRSWVDVYLLWPPPPESQVTWLLPNWPIEQ